MPVISKKVGASQGKGVQLHKNHAVIHTASIDVKILRLDKRQVTQSVFRQLDEKLIFNADGSLAGVPWGRVNYTWKGVSELTAFHVIWQQEDRLYRAPVPYRDISEFREWVAYDSWTPELKKASKPAIRLVEPYMSEVLQDIQNASETKYSYQITNRWSNFPGLKDLGKERGWFGTREGWANHCLYYNIQLKTEMMATVKKTFQEIKDRWNREDDNHKEFLRKLRDTIDKMGEIDQLFIAV